MKLFLILSLLCTLSLFARETVTGCPKSPENPAAMQKQLIELVKKGDLKGTEKLLKEYPDLQQYILSSEGKTERDRLKNTQCTFHYAARENNLEMLKLLFKYNTARYNYLCFLPVMNHSKTPLYIAAENHSITTHQYLMGKPYSRELEPWKPVNNHSIIDHFYNSDDQKEKQYGNHLKDLIRATGGNGEITFLTMYNPDTRITMVGISLVEVREQYTQITAFQTYFGMNFFDISDEINYTAGITFLNFGTKLNFLRYHEIGANTGVGSLEFTKLNEERGMLSMFPIEIYYRFNYNQYQFLKIGIASHIISKIEKLFHDPEDSGELAFFKTFNITLQVGIF